MTHYEAKYYEHEDIHVTAGDRVVLKKGAAVKTTHPQGAKTVTRKRTVTVHHMLRGSNAFAGHPGSEPAVRWTGSGGYWFWVSINDCEKVTK